MRRLAPSVVLALASLLIAFASRAEPIPGVSAEPRVPVASEVRTGRCISIADGDTLTVRLGTENVSVRLEGIDAPESRQDHGAKAKAALSDLVKGQTVDVHVTGTDRYKRTLAIVMIGGVNVNERLVEDGWAWQYDEYNDDLHLAELEEIARTERRGLWAHANAVAPWDFRRLERARRQLARDRQQGLVDAPAETDAAATDPVPATNSADESAVGYWLNTSSNVRHNSTCRYFKNTSKGRACSKDDGKACGICGG